MSDKTESTAESPARKPYQPPKLVVHGTVAELTATSGTGSTDLEGGPNSDP